MTIAGRISLSVASIVFVSTLALGSALSYQQYRMERATLLDRIALQLGAELKLPADIYFANRQGLQHSLQRLLDLSPALRFAAIRNSDGEIIEQTGNDDANTAQRSFSAIRPGADQLEDAIAEEQIETRPPGSAPIARLAGGEHVLHHTSVVFSPLNPTQPDLTRSDFADAIMAPRAGGSRHALGYVQLSLSRSLLLSQTLPSLILLLSVSVAFTLFCTLLARLAMGPMTRSLTQLADAAERIAEGEEQDTVRVYGGGEIGRMRNALNSMLGGITSLKTQSDVDQHLLRMKVDERTEQLSARNQELNKAVQQVTEAKDRLRHLAYYDSLTTLPNRRLFTEQLNLLLKLSRRSDGMLALLFLDLDNFKRINDSLGHAAGDLMLKEIARRLSSCVRESDVVAHFEERENSIGVSRLGGDEFTVVLNQIDSPERASMIAQRLLAAMLDPILVEGHEIVVTPSIGIAVAPKDGETLEQLLRAADTAMYHAKNTGKGNYLFYSNEMDAAGVERLALETDLRKAIERGELEVHYQPQVDTRNGTVCGVEALLRWQHPQRGTISPGIFIPLAEEIGIIAELGHWCLRQACGEIAGMLRAGHAPAKVAVNVSSLQFTADFDQVVASALEDSGLPPSALSLELTEGIAMSNSEHTLEILTRIKALGIRLSIDDFGTGYSSLSYISRFPLDELKIDRSFVIGLGSSDEQAGLVTAIIGMGHSLGLALVAEGVEDAAQYLFLTRHGATVIQGFLFSKPLPAQALVELLTPGHFASQIMDISGVIQQPPEASEEAAESRIS